MKRKLRPQRNGLRPCSVIEQGNCTLIEDMYLVKVFTQTHALFETIDGRTKTIAYDTIIFEDIVKFYDTVECTTKDNNGICIGRVISIEENKNIEISFFDYLDRIQTAVIDFDSFDIEIVCDK